MEPKSNEFHDSCPRRLNTKNDLEQILTLKEVEKAVRYMTQGLEDQWGTALVNLATKIYRGFPISNSILIHELTEAEEFEREGYEFASEEIDKMKSPEKKRLYLKKNKLIREREDIHLKALREQYIYLSQIAQERGFSIAPGTILLLSPITSIEEVRKAMDRYSNLKPTLNEETEGKCFVMDLLKLEPLYVEFFSKYSTDKNRIYLYERYGEELKKYLSD